MSVLKLDDLIKEDIVLEFNNKQYHYDLSFKAMIKFKKWSESNDLTQEITDIDSITSLIKIMIQEADDFVSEIDKLSVGNQTRIITTITEKWVKEMVPNSESNSKEKK